MRQDRQVAHHNPWRAGHHKHHCIGDVNLNAIAAAVIGGTSLFGGRGSAWSALLGVLVIMAISNGLTLLNLSSSLRFMITGGVLAFAVIVDSIARRSRASHGRA